MARLALGKRKPLPWSRFNKYIVYNNQIVFLPVPLNLSTALLAGSTAQSIHHYIFAHVIMAIEMHC